MKRKAGRVVSVSTGTTAQSNRNSVKNTNIDGRTARKMKAKQLAKSKRDAIIDKKRSDAGDVPRLVALVPLSSKVSMDEVESLITKVVEMDSAPRTEKHIGAVTVNVPRWKTKLQFYSVKQRNFIATVDIAKVADIIVFLMDPEEICDNFGRNVVSFIKAQGITSVFGVVQGLEKMDNPKKQKAQKKMAQDFFHQEFMTKSKILKLDNENDANQLTRFISESKVHQLTWRKIRPYLLVDKIDFKDGPDPSSGTLQVSGYLRGSKLNPNYVVHITGYGDALISTIEGGYDPYSFSRHKKNEMDVTVDDSARQVLATADPEKQETLLRDNPPDPFAAEQTWPTPEELEAAEKEMEGKRKVPVGTSAYQAVWIPEEEGEEGSEEQEEENEEGEDLEIEEVEEEPKAPVPKKPVVTKVVESAVQNKHTEEESGDDLDIDEDDDDDIDPEEKKKNPEEEEDEEDMLWPDEVDVPLDQPARHRFQKYRGLKSFRTSPWDPKENLPHDYSRIFQFQNFIRTYKRILRDNEGVSPNQYVTISIKDIAKDLFAQHPPNTPLVVSGLMKYENKSSTVHFKVQKHPSCTKPIKTKTPLEFHVGFRRMKIQPIFSENTNYSKFKYLKFLRGTSVATAYAPICFPPTPLVATDLEANIVGSGCLHSVNPDRIILKKIVLTGHPEKISKNRAIIRRMFYNAEDVRWFKPVELWTKYGRSGSITEPLAGKGKFKATFDSVMSNQDTVCMSLYKRAFPKWAQLDEMKKKDTDKEKETIN
uniref:Bms1-type G domain-containing protein n=1 Tax=Arcella intermedia TaxID=1963864 RepID=A0A6B2KYC9_9EUKA